MPGGCRSKLHCPTIISKMPAASRGSLRGELAHDHDLFKRRSRRVHGFIPGGLEPGAERDAGIPGGPLVLVAVNRLFDLRQELGALHDADPTRQRFPLELAWEFDEPACHGTSLLGSTLGHKFELGSGIREMKEKCNMTHRNVRKEDFVGKTIVDIDCAAVNVVGFKFEDGTTCALEGEILSPQCPIPIIQWCGHCAESCEVEEETTRTIITPNGLHNATHTWLTTAIDKLPDVATEGQDLYLRLVANAARLPYEEVLRRYQALDPGIVEARRTVKRHIFNRLLAYPSSVLSVHDEHVIEVQEPAAVESRDAEV